MTGKAPDATSIFHLTAPAADDAALKTLLGTATGNQFRVGPEHFLVSSAQVTDIVVGKDGAQWRVSWPKVDWLILRAIDVTDLKNVEAVRPCMSDDVVVDN